MFNQKTFTPVSSHGNSDSPNAWSYRTADTKAEVIAAGYFSSKYPILNDGDFLQLVTSDSELIGTFTQSGDDFIITSISEVFDPQIGMVVERTLEAVSLAADQQPTLRGKDNALPLEFGAAQGSVSDPVMIDVNGLTTFNQLGLNRISAILQFGRTGSSGTSVLFFRFLVNGLQLGRSVAEKLSNADDLAYIEITNWFNIPPGVTLQVEVMRDLSGSNFGGVFETIPTDEGAGTWNPSPCAVLRIERMVAA